MFLLFPVTFFIFLIYLRSTYPRKQIAILRLDYDKSTVYYCNFSKGEDNETKTISTSEGVKQPFATMQW
ncbi:MAG: hypothetical protein IJS08_16965, partial [Victivallales bacterium]|nr:hypothetical protein [Victivallales bacterium]